METIKTIENINKVANIILETSEYYFIKAEENDEPIDCYFEEAQEEAENLDETEFLKLLK